MKLKFINSPSIKFGHFSNFRKKIFLKLSSNQKSFHNNKGRRKKSQLVFKIEEKIIFHKLNLNESVIFFVGLVRRQPIEVTGKKFSFTKKNLSEKITQTATRERERVSE